MEDHGASRESVGVEGGDGESSIVVMGRDIYELFTCLPIFTTNVFLEAMQLNHLL